MDSEIVFRVITLVFLAAAFGISGTFRRRADREGGGLRSAAGNRLIVILRLLGLAILLPLLAFIFAPQWVTWARFPVPEWARWLAAAVLLACLPGIVWIFRSIGNNISPSHTTRHGHQLVTHGPYRWVRHPLYSLASLALVALSLLTALWWLAIAMLIPAVILFLRTRREEASLVAEFGDAYRDYMRRTGAFFPRIGR